MSNQLYGSDVTSAYKLSHGFTNTLSDQTIVIRSDIISVQIVHEAIGKLTRSIGPSPLIIFHFPKGIMLNYILVTVKKVQMVIAKAYYKTCLRNQNRLCSSHFWKSVRTTL